MPKRLSRTKRTAKALTEPRPKKTQILIEPIYVPDSFFTDNNLSLSLFDLLPPGTEIPTTESIVSQLLTPAQRRSAAWKLDGEVQRSRPLGGVCERVVGLDVRIRKHLKAALENYQSKGLEEGGAREEARIDREGVVGLLEMAKAKAKGRGDGGNEEDEMGMVVLDSEVRKELGWE